MSPFDLLCQKASIHHFCRDRRGNVAMMFALALVPTVGLVGAATDYGRALSARANLQVALDATALAVTKNAATMTPAQLQAAAQTFFNGVFHGDGTPAPTIKVTYNPPNGSAATVVVSGSISVPMTVTGLLGTPSLTVGSSSTTTWGFGSGSGSTRLRVALALDNTGSMNSAGKIGALQTAATNLINQLQTAAQSNGDVYVSIVPFARVVNVGPGSVSASWIDWTDWEAAPPNSTPSTSVGPGSPCPYDTSNGSVTGYFCMSSPDHTSSNALDTIATTGTYAGYICPGVDSGQYNTASARKYYNGCYNSVANQTCTTKKGKTTCVTSSYNHTWIANAHTTWDGSIEDRAQNSDVSNTPPTNAATNFPAIQAFLGDPTPQALVAPSYDWIALKKEVSNMVPGGGTNQAIGLAWAWQSLTQSAPLNAPAKDPNYAYSDVIILLSDGLNTEDRWYGNGYSVSPQVDARQSQLCSKIWATGTTKIYTIQVNTDGDPTSKVLQDCGTDPKSGASYFFNLTSANQIISTFQTIGTQLSQLRISK